MSRLSFILLFTTSLFCITYSQPAGEGNIREDFNIKILKTDQPITLDGDLSEQVWSESDVATDFWMSYPIDDQLVATELQTEVRIVYDEENIYLGVVCKGDNKHIIQTLKRDTDFWDGDAFAVVIDPLNERTNGFIFGVNPAGVQTELLITGQTGRRTRDRQGPPPSGLNLAWDNKWYSEVSNHADKWTIEIAIPFKILRYNAGKNTWGINFVRGDANTNSYHTWSPVPLQFISMDLGYTGSLMWEQNPKKIKGNLTVIPYVLSSTYRDFENSEPSDNDVDAGVDVKVSLTSSLNLDLTLNPDFSQVEVDEQVTNLTLFDIRFPEKRNFFLENSDLFEDFGIPPMRPFFSRKIGLDPDGNNIPIFYGLRLSGNINKDLRLGLMSLQTRKTEEFLVQNYSSLALHHQLFKRSVVKGYFHNRQARENGEFKHRDYNRTAGMEFSFQSTDSKWRFLSGYGKAFSPGISDENYFFNLAGGYDSKTISIYSNLAGVGNDYISDIGFIPSQQHYDVLRDTFFRVGFHHWYSRFSYSFYPENNPKVISHSIAVRNIRDMRTNWSLLNNNTEFTYSLQFTNTAMFQVQTSHSLVHLLYPFDFTGKTPLPAGKYQFDFAALIFNSDIRKPLSLEGGIQYGSFYSGRRTRYVLGVKYRAQPWGNFGVLIEQNELNFPEPLRDASLTLISPKIELNFSNNLFWTTFLKYNTQEDNFNINSRFQWRFQPMSDIYLVYTDNRAVEIWGPKNRALVLKVNYWFNL
jgi:hypothetical protein